MKRRAGFLFTLTAIGALLLLAVPAPATDNPESGNKPIETFTAIAASMQTGQSGIVEININRWSTDAERTVLIDLLKMKGQQAMVAELQKLPQVGYIKMPTTMGYALFYARSNPLPDGGRQVVFATDRNIGMAGAAPQLSQYDVSVVEIQFDKAGKGKGKLVPAAKASVDKNGKVQIQNYQGAPLMLMDIKVKQ